MVKSGVDIFYDFLLLMYYNRPTKLFLSRIYCFLTFSLQARATHVMLWLFCTNNSITREQFIEHDLSIRYETILLVRKGL